MIFFFNAPTNSFAQHAHGVIFLRHEHLVQKEFVGALKKEIMLPSNSIQILLI